MSEQNYLMGFFCIFAQYENIVMMDETTQMVQISFWWCLTYQKHKQKAAPDLT